MEIVFLKINGKNVWLVFEEIYAYRSSRSLEPMGHYLCYLSFALPVVQPFGELIMNESGQPAIFKSMDDAQLMAMQYARVRINNMESSSS